MMTKEKRFVKLKFYGEPHTGRTQIVSLKEGMPMTKKEQLKLVFRKEILEAFDKVVPKNRRFTGNIGKVIEETTNVLLKEVSIRTPLK